MRNHSPGFAHMEIMVAQSPEGVCATIFYGVKRRGNAKKGRKGRRGQGEENCQERGRRAYVWGWRVEKDNYLLKYNRIQLNVSNE